LKKGDWYPTFLIQQWGMWLCISPTSAVNSISRWQTLWEERNETFMKYSKSWKKELKSRDEHQSWKTSNGTNCENETNKGNIGN
jgi:hypothetical protein